MSRETLATLNTQTLIGYTAKRGNAWHYRADEQGDEPNHYTGAIPIEDVRRRLFDWKPLEADVQATLVDDDGVHTITDDTRKAIVRSDTREVLGIFKRGYQAHEYGQWLLNNVESILDADLAIGSAGLLRRGAVAWVQVEMAETIDTPEGESFRPFLMATTSLDGSLATTYLTGATRVVCDNTHSAALFGASEQFKVRHSSKSLGKLNDVREALNIVHATADDFAEQVAQLTRVDMSDAQWHDFLHKLMAPATDSTRARNTAQRKIDQLDAMYRNDERVTPWAGTAWGALTAVNTWTHHEAPIRGERAERNMERAATGKIETHDKTAYATLGKVLQLA